MPDDICGATTRDGDPCARPAGWGTDHNGEGRCKQHGGASPGAPSGAENGNADHLGFSDQLDLSESESGIIEAFVDAVDVNSLDPVWTRLAGEAFVRYHRSDDSRHLAECRRCLENAGDGDDAVTLGDIELAADFSD